MHHLLEVPFEPEHDPDVIASLLWSFGAVGVEERPESLVGAFTAVRDAAAAVAELGGVVTPVDDHTGIDAWRDHATAQDAGPFRIRPPWLQPGSGIEIVIDPGHAFGSGAHPSTRLALALVAEAVGEGNRVLDIGVGSGVLAIGAALLGARVVAVDTDPAAAPATRTNSQANGVADLVEFRTGSVEIAAGRYDLATINVTIDIHESVAPTVIAGLRTPLLVVAGILSGHQEERCAAAYRRPVVIRQVDGEWAGLILGPYHPDR